jgi:4-hydroxy-3-polyprenylbenzoate decarboxylase
MAYKNQQQFIDTLDKAGELIRIKTYVDPRLEIAEITDRVSKTKGGGKALLFENTGYDFPVLMNAYGSERRMCLALGVKRLNDIAHDIEPVQTAGLPQRKHYRQAENTSQIIAVRFVDAARKKRPW